MPLTTLSTGSHDEGCLAVEDRLAIHDLYARQAHLIDNGDHAGWAATFTASGSFTSATFGGTATGASELIEFARMSDAPAATAGHQFRHWISAIDICEAHGNCAESRVYLMIVRIGTDDVRIERSVVMRDELTRQDGRWLVASRVTTRDPSTRDAVPGAVPSPD